jgi:hypothetical protein
MSRKCRHRGPPSDEFVSEITPTFVSGRKNICVVTP